MTNAEKNATTGNGTGEIVYPSTLIDGLQAQLKTIDAKALQLHTAFYKVGGFLTTIKSDYCGDDTKKFGAEIARLKDIKVLPTNLDKHDLSRYMYFTRNRDRLVEFDGKTIVTPIKGLSIKAWLKDSGKTITSIQTLQKGHKKWLKDIDQFNNPTMEGEEEESEKEEELNLDKRSLSRLIADLAQIKEKILAETKAVEGDLATDLKTQLDIVANDLLAIK